jgi:hypothetical protein
MDIPVMGYSGGQFVGHEMRLYWADESYDYGTITGIIAEDTLAPLVSSVELPPDVVPLNSHLQFIAGVSENDTLSRVELRIISADDSVAIPMGWTGTDYMAEWTVPNAGRYWYRIEAEDFWENIGSVPNVGWATFVTEGWIDEADSVFVLRSSFLVSVFPNPSNGWPNLRLSPEWFAQGIVTITVFNVLGQKIMERSMFSESMLSAFDAQTASGIFLLEVSTPTHHDRQKFMILK